MNPIPLGSTVRWRDAIARTPWVGTVTAHITDKMVECDGKGGISVGLLEVIEVGEMYDESAMDMATHGLVDREELDAMRAERDALQALVAEQCVAMALMVPDVAADALTAELQKTAKIADQQKARADTLDGELQKANEYVDFAAKIADYLEGYLLAIYGERRPVRPIEPRELRDLVNFVFEGV